MIKKSTAELAELIGAKIFGSADVEIIDVSKIEEADINHVSFIANPAYQKYLDTTKAGAVIVGELPANNEDYNQVFLLAGDPYRAFLAALQIFHPAAEKPVPGIHETATVADDAIIGKNVFIGPSCVIESGAKIGDNCILRSMVFIGKNVNIGNDCLFHSRVSIREECQIGHRVIVQDGAVIGSDGFGFAPGEEAYLKIPQVGCVVIEDDVEVGANTTIDRATLGETRVKKGAKLDNLIQIAHNVVIGENSVIAAQTGIAGSSKLGKWTMLGGQVGISGHIRMSDNVKVAAQSGLHADPGEGKIVGGYPAVDIGIWRRINASMKKLPDLVRRVRQIEKQLEANSEE